MKFLKAIFGSGACPPFTIKVSDVDGAVIRARALLESSGGWLLGNSFSGGTFLGKQGRKEVMGNFVPVPDGFSVTITDKPMLASCSMIEEKVREYFA